MPCCFLLNENHRLQFLFLSTLTNRQILRIVDFLPLFDKVHEILNKSELVKNPNAQCLLSDKQYFFSFPGSTSDVLSIIFRKSRLSFRYEWIRFGWRFKYFEGACQVWACWFFSWVQRLWIFWPFLWFDSIFLLKSHNECCFEIPHF